MSGEKKEKGFLDEFAEWWGVEDDAPAAPKVETPKVETPTEQPKEKVLKRGKRVQTFFLEEDDEPTPEPKPKKEPKPKEGE